MLQDIGERIRILRTSKGISLNSFAEKLDISTGYLSNLETGKTDTIQLSLLQALQEELHLFSFYKDEVDELESRLLNLKDKLKQLEETNPQAANFLISTIEKGIEVYLPKN
ncbi:helix-turn-helix domain-containing protein [Rossellomorea aquimaris]|uniref:helix-turn-helix domain-containing protein n=1 Tax=Rossellomorea aquimaris TaxID=189382 RepID=UPI0011E95CC4|nr:helix-turn-helix transcriptional regulator [Rossellomorea aquimaris]TYS87716.1 helix-turn-helix transcriptional regulator [Rossellomorea aquimaris]